MHTKTIRFGTDRKKAVHGLAAAALLAVLVSTAACGDRTGTAVVDMQPLAVQTERAELRLSPVLHELPATVVPADRAVLSAKVMGVVVDIPVELGDRVERGQLLVRIGAQELVARVEQARVADRQAARDLERETELLQRNAATAESVRNLEDRRQMTSAMLQEAETLLSYTRIEAPFSGRIARKQANTGDLASPGSPLLEVESSDRLRIEVEAPERLSRTLQRGDGLRVTLEGEPIEATVAEMSSAADPRSRTVQVKLDFPAGVAARSGMFARVSMPAGEMQSVWVPTAAISAFGQLERVFVVEEGVARLRIVRTGVSAEGWTAILSGLEGGESVILNPSRALAGGRRVETR